MLELNGKYNTAKVFTDVIDNESISQIINLLNQSYIQGSTIRMMPDVHAGAGCTIGTTMTIKDKVCPNLVGVDISCGMHTVKLKEKHIELQKLDKLIRSEVPSGFSIRNTPHRFTEKVNLEDLYCAKFINMNRAIHSIGTLGGGNHFIEANKDDDGNIYIVVHSGSRHLGVEIANYYQNAGYEALTTYNKNEIQNIINQLKKEGRNSEIQSTISNLKTKHTTIPKPLAYVEGDLFEQYIHDIKIAELFAEYNRKAIIDVIVKGMGLHIAEQFTTVHNYIDTDNMILRKGAVSAKQGEILLVPMNMRDGSLLCVGKGNADWNYSAPHGAGRLMSRSQAKETFTVSEYKKEMSGIYTTSVNSSTLDECPMAYKRMEDIVDNISPTVEIQSVIKPIYNFKAGEES